MNPEYARQIAAFPPPLRDLIEAELSAGNEIVEVASCFPAPPVGAYVKLAKKVSTRPRACGEGLDFYERNSSSYCGEFTDAKRFYFVIEAPNPPPPEPDTDAIRALSMPSPPAKEPRRRKPKTSPATTPRPESAVERFAKGMAVDYEKWHDGIGHDDLEILSRATARELAEIEALLLGRGVTDWRDVEALAALGTPQARAELRKTMKIAAPELATAVLRHAPHLASKAERRRILVAALNSAEVYGGLSQTLMEVEAFHPPQVIDALLKGTLARPGAVAVHFAAMLTFLHGKAKSSFDWEQRPFFLRFNTASQAERELAFRELCEQIGVDALKYLS